MKKRNNHFTRHKWKYLVAIICIAPVIIGALYWFLFQQIVSAGDVLSYYGVAVGLFASVYKYSEDRRKEKKERLKNASPRLTVELKQNIVHPKVFDIKIQSHKENLLLDVYLYDVFACGFINKNSIDRTVAFCLNKEEKQKLSNYANIAIDSEILDQDGYPKYIQIACDDNEGNIWVCEFEKHKIGSETVYRPLTPWIA